MSRHATIAGELTANGNAVFGRNVRVKGWLDAPNTKHAYKGLYPDEEALATAYPRPQAGWYALVAAITTVTDDDGTEKAALEGNAVIWLALRGDGGRYEWTATNLYTTELNSYVEDVEAAIESAITSCLEIIHDAVDDPVVDADHMDEVTDLGEMSGRTRWAVTRTTSGGKTFKVGTLDLFSDNMSHVLTQVYTTHEELKTGDDGATYFNGDHTDAYIYWYMRSYSIMENTLGTAAGSWTDWTLCMTSTTEQRLSTLEENAATGTDISADDPLHVDDQSVTGNKVAFKITIDEATQTARGTLSAADKVKLDALDTTKVVQETDISGIKPLTLEGKITAGKLVVTGEVAEATEEQSGLMSADDKRKLGGIKEATAEKAGLMTAADKATFDKLMDWLRSGAVTHGTMRFTGIHCFSSSTSTLIEDEEADGYDGIVWLTDKKIFAAYRALELIDGQEQYIYWTLWDTVSDYMETPGVAGGLWQDKVYICFGYVWVWKRCDTQLVCAGGGEDFDVITEEEIDAMMADFEFVELPDYLEHQAITKEEIDEWFDETEPAGGTQSPYITDVEAAGDGVLELSAKKDGAKAVITGGIKEDALATELTAEDIDAMF